MGYTTDFTGSFKLDKPLTVAHKLYLDKFSDSRRMKRDAVKTALRPDPARLTVGLPVGKEGEYFVGAGEFAGQEHSPDVVDFNNPPKTQPGLWCQWVSTEDGAAIEWNGAEKFYYYIEWIEYMIKNFFEPWGYSLDGNVKWSGEESSDLGSIVIKKNIVTAKKAKIKY